MNSHPIYTELEKTAKFLEIPFYWMDLNHTVMGANDLLGESIGTNSAQNVVGKTPYDLYPYDFAHTIVLNHQSVIKSGKKLVIDEVIQNITSNIIQYYTSTIWALRDDNGAIIGTVGTSIDITAKKNLNHEKVLMHLEMIAEILPVPVIWLDVNQKAIGVNNVAIENMGAKFRKKEAVGLTVLDVYPEAMAKDIMRNRSNVVHTGQLFSGEEVIKDITSGQIKYFNVVIAPLRNDEGNIIGTIEIGLDITAKKEAERLKLENKNQKIEHQEKLITLAHTVAHDISSPISALNMMMQACDELPEKKRLVIKRAIESILDIANNLLSTYRSEEQQTTSEIEQRQPLLISDLIVQLLSEKKAQYSNHTVRFETEIANDAQFAFAQMQTSQFRRSLSNLINNAVDALANKEQDTVAITLSADDDFIVVKIQDNGKGMSSDMIQKMMNRQSFSEGKANGHGIGLQQVWDTLDNNQGTMTVSSIPNEGTTIQLTFPRICAASWIAQTIHLVPNSITVILDDEESIHGAWDTRFVSYVKSYPTLVVHHFKQGQEALDFFSKLNPKDKDRVVFLSDYELLRQAKNGLKIIEESGIKNTTLVTSYYANSQIRDKAVQLDVKILPKQMASIVPIEIDENRSVTHFFKSMRNRFSTTTS